MRKPPKPDLDETTVDIARRMLSTPPKHHDEMKVGRAKPKRAKDERRRKARKSRT
jgi:hypothetical protein